MAAFQSTALGIALLTLTTGASTCHGQSASSDVAKDPGPGVDVTLPGVDTSSLTPRERREWSSYVSVLLAPCANVPVSLAQCILEKRACSKCGPAAKFVLKGVRDGLAQDQIEKAFHNRFDADRIKDVAVLESPTKGPAGAPITLIEFADFECPYCAIMAPRLDEAFNKFTGQIRFVYKFMPLSGHPHGEISARAAIAALDQGKFWPMHDLLFVNRDHLEPPDLDSYAKQLGLDMNRFHQDQNSQATTDRIAADRKQADELDVKGTPTIYINGRDYDPQSDLADWISLELGGESKTHTTSAEASEAGARGPTSQSSAAPKK